MIAGFHLPTARFHRRSSPRPDRAWVSLIPPGHCTAKDLSVILPRGSIKKLMKLRKSLEKPLFIWIFSSLISFIECELTKDNQKLSWIIGKWRSEFSGKIFWPTVPTMTYGEELIIAEAPMAKTTNAQFLNYSARAWSHSTKDHFHDEWGFITAEPSGNATLMTTGNNGFTTYEVGKVETNKLTLTLKDIGRISFSRDLPVEDLRRIFIRHDDTYMEQILEMRTGMTDRRFEDGIKPEPSAASQPLITEINAEK
ncbi:THAP domain-containing protein 4 [Ditylenchus destructor]|uniref:THAP domain-containing protein 4 n=1 Tax=Ditylenchus destructor TaxID=166010 RepID=A0AAD4NCB5_9BILA|nr:THAP domain-containing protein 4 [Ditylenchus destructor]